ncbi:MAG: NusG domain II-containing protein [Lachnospiraceae bacterium]|nr:NusG domain II-containing protein [Lachnospiraceae bacterium]
MKKRDLILIISILLIAGIVYGVTLFTSSNGKRVVVTVDKETVIDESLSKNQELLVPQTNGENTILIKNGQVTMKEADCPDQICVHHKAITKSGETIVCLPHKVVVEIISDEESDVDIVAYKGEKI